MSAFLIVALTAWLLALLTWTVFECASLEDLLRPSPGFYLAKTCAVAVSLAPVLPIVILIALVQSRIDFWLDRRLWQSRANAWGW